MKRKDPIKSVALVNAEMDTQFIGEHGIRLDLIAKTSSNELLNMVLCTQTDSSMEESEMQKKYCVSR